MRPLIIGFVLLATTSTLYAAPKSKEPQKDSPAGHDQPAAAAGPMADGEHEPTGKATDYYWEKSDVAFHAGEYERVLGLHKAIVALDPHDTESYAVYAWIAWSMGNNQEATDHIERGLKANPDSWEMWKVAAEQYQFMKLWPLSQEAYGKAIALAPKEEDTQMMRRQLAHTAQNAGDLQFSAETWRALVKDYPKEDVNKNNLARVEEMIADKAKPGPQTSSLETGHFMMTSAGLLGALIVPALVQARVSTARSSQIASAHQRGQEL